MRSFGARADTVCWDEPFFAAFLDQTGLDHPGRAETLAQCETDIERLIERITTPIDRPYHFQKHMAHHMVDAVPTDWMAEARHVLLLRHPARVIVSYAKGRPDFTADDLGFTRLLTLYTRITDLTGHPPMVVDSDAILQDPETMLRAICEQGFGIPFDQDMLSWPSGSRAEDGPWAPYWYHTVETSTGFGLPPGALPTVPSPYKGILDDCCYVYDRLSTL